MFDASRKLNIVRFLTAIILVSLPRTCIVPSTLFVSSLISILSAAACRNDPANIFESTNHPSLDIFDIMSFAIGVCIHITSS